MVHPRRGRHAQLLVRLGDGGGKPGILRHGPCRHAGDEVNPSASVIDPAPGAVPLKSGRYRWVICSLLFFATTINYIDRQVLGILAPLLQTEIGWNEIQYGYIVTAFQAAYALGLIVVGRLIDRFGTKIGYSVSIVLWSIAAMAHAVTRSAAGFGAARFALGLGE